MKTIIKAVHEAMKEHFINLLIQQFKHHLFLIKLKEFGVDINESAGIDNWNTVVDLIGFPNEDSIHTPVNNKEDNFTRKAMFSNYLNTLTEIPVNNNLCISTQGHLTVEDSFDMEVTKLLIAKHVQWLFLQYENYLELQDY